MTDFTPSPLQARAICAIKEWFENRTEEQAVFRVWGYAGSGKTTITKHAIAELGLDTMTRAPDDAGSATGGVLYGAFTGKAALVMTRKGTPASTIHSLIYRVSEATKEEIERVKDDIAAIKAKLPKLGQRERFLEESRLRSLELRLDDIHKPRFVLNEQSIVRDAKLIVLDEVSMVGAEMAADLLAFGKPILVLGDPGQLPPIKGDGAFTKDAPDVMLTEIHRQAGESAIIRLATMARQSQPIAYGEHDAFVWKMRRDEVGPVQMLRGGQVICGRNATRIQLNMAMKEAAGYPDVYPIGEAANGHAEKIICLKNRNDIGVVNGMFLEFSDVRDETAHCFSAVVRSEDGETLGAGSERHFIYKGHFEDHVAPDASVVAPVPIEALAGGKPTMPVILALDLGQRTGWAVRPADGKINSGTTECRQDRWQGGGIKFLLFRRWLTELKNCVGELDLVVFEQVRRHVSVDSSHAYGGWLAILTAWCEHHGIPYHGVPVGTIKRHVTGKGNADKAAVIAAVRKLGFQPADDNEADALALLLWAIHAGLGERQ